MRSPTWFQAAMACAIRSNTTAPKGLEGYWLKRKIVSSKRRRDCDPSSGSGTAIALRNAHLRRSAGDWSSGMGGRGGHEAPGAAEAHGVG